MKQEAFKEIQKPTHKTCIHTEITTFDVVTISLPSLKNIHTEYFKIRIIHKHIVASSVQLLSRVLLFVAP